MKEEVLNTLQELGFLVEEMDDCGYGFRYEGLNYLYMPNDNDEDFLSLSLPGVFDMEDAGETTGLRLSERLNSSLKYVKAYWINGNLWLFYERELYGGEDMKRLVSRMVLHLEAALIQLRRFQTKAEDEAGNDND